MEDLCMKAPAWPYDNWEVVNGSGHLVEKLESDREVLEEIVELEEASDKGVETELESGNHYLEELENEGAQASAQKDTHSDVGLNWKEPSMKETTRTVEDISVSSCRVSFTTKEESGSSHLTKNDKAVVELEDGGSTAENFVEPSSKDIENLSAKISSLEQRLKVGMGVSSSEGSKLEDFAVPLHRLHLHDLPPGKSSLSTLLESFSHTGNIFDDEVNRSVFEEINLAMKTTIDRLRTTCKPFESCRLIQAGSVAEGTKIGIADEFDFLLVIESFSDRTRWRIVLNKGVIAITSLLEDVEANAEQFSGMEGLQEFIEETEVPIISSNIRGALIDEFISGFDETLAGNGEWVRLARQSENTEGETAQAKKVCSSDIASTLHLFSSRRNLYVDVDICLCLPLNLEIDMENIQLFSQGDNSFELFNYLKSLHDVSPFETFVILGSSTQMWPGVITSRVTAPLLELSRFTFYGPVSTRLMAYRLAKHVVSNFLPKATSIFGCKRCCHSLVRSYYLKNIVFFMMKNYEEEDYWSEDKIPFRVLEMFAILKQCIISPRSKHMAAKISTCCTPSELYIECLQNYVKNCSIGGHRQLFPDDSDYKPRNEISVSPEYTEKLKTESLHADSLIKKWFQHLHHENWSTYNLITDLYELLEDLARN